MCSLGTGRNPHVGLGTAGSGQSLQYWKLVPVGWLDLGLEVEEFGLWKLGTAEGEVPLVVGMEFAMPLLSELAF